MLGVSSYGFTVCSMEEVGGGRKVGGRKGGREEESQRKVGGRESWRERVREKWERGSVGGRNRMEEGRKGGKEIRREE